jgi:hypothetical protein
MSFAADKARAAAVARVYEYMAKRRLTLEDLLDYGGEDLPAPKHAEPRVVDARVAEKALHVEKTWALMAKLSVHYAHLEAAPSAIPRQTTAKATPRHGFFQVTENKQVLDLGAEAPPARKFLKNNNKKISAPVGVLERNPAGRES